MPDLWQESAAGHYSNHKVVEITAESTQPKTLRQLLMQLDAQNVTDYRRYEAVRKFLNFKARDKAVPISGSFELTPLCNLDCKMCYVHLNKAQMHGMPLLTTEQWKDIMQQAVDNGMMYARLTGGECLTYPGFRELYLFLREHGIEITVLSNGLLLNEEMVAFFKEHPPAAIQITLYGADEDAYERVTGHRAFGLVMKNICLVRNANIPVVIAVTPNAYMTDGEDIVRLLHREEIPFNINAGILEPRRETGRVLADASLDTYISILKLVAGLKGMELLAEPDPESLPDTNQDQGSALCGVTCGAGRSCFAIDWKGGMRPCNTFPCEGENVPELGFVDAWRRTNHTATNFPIPAECQGCAYQRVCMHCVADHAAGAPIGHASPAVCARGKRMVTEGLLSLNNG